VKRIRHFVSQMILYLGPLLQCIAIDKKISRMRFGSDSDFPRHPDPDAGQYKLEAELFSVRFFYEIHNNTYY
jgi:hypothetical protein